MTKKQLSDFVFSTLEKEVLNYLQSKYDLQPEVDEDYDEEFGNSWETILYPSGSDDFDVHPGINVRFDWEVQKNEEIKLSYIDFNTCIRHSNVQSYLKNYFYGKTINI